MYHSQAPWVDLCSALLNYEGPDTYEDLLKAWPEANAAECRWFVEFGGRGIGGADAVTDEDLCRLYAASRVSQLLLLRFQSGRADGTDYRGPSLSVEGFRLFHEAVGFRVPPAAPFHPFFHEIVEVRQAADPAVRPETVGELWPTLMLGDMMYCRGGCAVTVGAEHAVKATAEGSKLYWAFRRKNRPYEDQSHGWGGNSQWRTRLRRDYATPSGFRYNVDGGDVLNTATRAVDGTDAATLIELVRHRCLVRTALPDTDFYPYSYAYREDTA